MEDLLEAAPDGRAIGLVTAWIANSHQWPGLAFVEVTDIPASETAVASGAENPSGAVRTFVALAAKIANKRTRPHTNDASDIYLPAGPGGGAPSAPAIT